MYGPVKNESLCQIKLVFKISSSFVLSYKVSIYFVLYFHLAVKFSNSVIL